MLAGLFCHNFVTKALPWMHIKTRKSLINHVKSLLGGRASLSSNSIGRNLPGPALVKHKINMTWRFLCNKTLQHHQELIYKGFCNQITSTLSELMIAVDWSGCCNNINYMLRASLVYKGRSISLYNEIHPVQTLGNEEVHNGFLRALKEILPSGKQVTILTDSGFKTPWFKEIERLGWFFIGRVSGVIKYSLDSKSKDWHLIEHLHHQVQYGETRFLGKGMLTKERRGRMQLVFIAYWGIKKGRKVKNPKYPAAEKQYSKMNSEPWILVSNLYKIIPSTTEEECYQLAALTRDLYKKRMQIEQNFRDDKNGRLGFGWRFSGTNNINKISILVLIATIASCILWMIGFAAEKKNLQYAFQANTVRSTRVLSFIFLAKELIANGLKKLNIRKFSTIITMFQLEYNQNSLFKPRGDGLVKI
jgi:hypothetical protein